MRQDRRATCYTLAIQEHRSLEIDIADKREMRAGEMIGNMGPQSTPVNFLMGSLDPLSMEPCGLMWNDRGAQHGAQLAGWPAMKFSRGIVAAARRFAACQIVMGSKTAFTCPAPYRGRTRGSASIAA